MMVNGRYNIVAGEETPITVTITGVDPAFIQAYISDGSIKGSRGRYIIDVPNKGAVSIIVGSKSFDSPFIPVDTFYCDVR